MDILTFKNLSIALFLALLAALIRSYKTQSLAWRRLAAIEAASDGIGITDQEGNLVYMNRALMELHQISDASAYIGHPWVNLYTEKGREDIRNKVLPALNTHGIWRGESLLLTESGNVLIGELSLTLLPDGGFIGTARNITERKKNEEEREILREKIVQSQKMEMVGTLSGGIAHDFNNMLTIISGNLEILEDHIRHIPAAQNNFLAAQRAVRRGAELTQRLLAFSRQQILVPRVVNINTIIPDTVNMMRRTLGENIEIILYLGDDLWSIRIDTGQIENALLNLCINSRDAMPEGGAITIKTANVTQNGEEGGSANIPPGDYVRIDVCDTGSGIPPAMLGRVFEPFFTTKEKGMGSGLGLSMVYGFTKQSNGHLTLNSEPGEGTCVSLYFPKALDAAEAIAEPLPKPVSSSGKNKSVIMVVEDEEDVLTYNKDLLSGLGYCTYAARNGAEAVLLLDRIQQLDLLITDVIMPGGVNGRDLAEEARNMFPQVKILFVSGYARETLNENVLKNDHTDFLPKPYTRAKLMEHIETLLGRG